MAKNYALLDSGSLYKWEAFGNVVIKRPCPVALWEPCHSVREDVSFSREHKKGWSRPLKPWIVEEEGLRLKLMQTDFGHVGAFFDHAIIWEELRKRVEKNDKVLNLFAYTGAASLVMLQKGASVVHVDASKPAIAWAKENAVLNGLEKGSIRYLLEDAMKFVRREVTRKSHYEGIILDPPTFGRGAKNEVFKIEEDLPLLLEGVCQLLKERGKFLILSCHTPGLTPLVLKQILNRHGLQELFAEEMILGKGKPFSVPVGAWAIWTRT